MSQQIHTTRDMSLFVWSTPKRQRAGQILPIIPNEIYLCIFELIVPSTGRLVPGEFEVLAKLSRVCRFFANVCLPRIFEFVEFSGSTLRGDMSSTRLYSDTVYQTTRELTLCTQIAAKQPLVLSLAKRVRCCHFTNWQRDATGLRSVQLFAEKCLTGMSHMNNIRELRFSASVVDGEHWRAITSLESLEELSFESCHFLLGPSGAEHEDKAKVRVSHLRLTNCTGHRQPISALDPRYLRALTADCMFCDEVDWLPQCTLTELNLPLWQPIHQIQPLYLEQVRTVLAQAPQSLKALWLSADITTEAAQGMIQKMFSDPAWKNLSLLHSLTLRVLCEDSDTPTNVLSFVLDCIGLLTDLRSFTLKSHTTAPTASPPTEVRRILSDKLGPSSSLTRVDIYEKVFCLVDREWSEVHL